MFTKEELKPGAKRVVLEYIAEHGVPIAKIIQKEQLEGADRYYFRDNPIIIRADHACQWDGFAGIFPSIFVPGEIWSDGLVKYCKTEELSIDQLIDFIKFKNIHIPGYPGLEDSINSRVKRNKDELIWYSNGLGLAESDAPFDAEPLIQEKHSKSHHLFQHPSDENLVIIYFNKNFKKVIENLVLYARDKDEFRYRTPRFDDKIGNLATTKLHPDEEGFLRQAVAYYDKISSLPKFSDEWTYEMEFGAHKKTGECLIYQVRLFRQKQKRTFSLEPKQGDNIMNFDIALGITPPEGILLTLTPYVRFDRSRHPKHFSGYIENLSNAGGDLSSTYPHISLPGIEGVFYKWFNYNHSHGARESLMKVPIVLLDWSERHVSPEMIDSHYEIMRLKIGQEIRVFSDGRKGRIEF